MAFCKRDSDLKTNPDISSKFEINKKMFPTKILFENKFKLLKLPIFESLARASVRRIVI